MLVEGFSFPQEFKISFEIRFTTFSLKKNAKISRKKSLVTLLNLVYLLILADTGNRKFIIFCWQIADTRIIRT